MLRPMDHQVKGIAWLKDRPNALLADEPGLGKSMQLLRSATEPILVVAPAMVLDSGTWDDEVAKWAPGADVTQVSYSSLCARTGRRIPKDSNGNPIVQLKPEYQRKFGTVICDESHYLKSRRTTWTLGVQKIADIHNKNRPAEIKLATGTPLPNWAHEAFTTLQLVYPERSRMRGQFGSYWRWVREWFEISPSPFGGEHSYDVGDLRQDHTWEEFYAENWGDNMLLRLRENCVDLPPMTEQPWNVRMTKDQARVYRALKNDFIAWLDNGQTVFAWNSASQLVKLAKCATGLESLDPGARGSGKLDALRSILRDRPRPTLVTGHFRTTVAACERAAEQVGASVLRIDGTTRRSMRKEAVRSFQSGNLQVLCASVETIAEGLTLVAADQVVQVEKSWKPSKNAQVLYRLHRIGQTRPVLAIDLVSKDTVDEGVRNLLQRKTDQQMKALGIDALRQLARG